MSVAVLDMLEGLVYIALLLLFPSPVNAAAKMSPGLASLYKHGGHGDINTCILLLGVVYLHDCWVSTFSCCHSKSPLSISRHLWGSSQETWRTKPLICFCLFDVCSLQVTGGGISPLSLTDAVLSASVPCAALSPTVPHFITWAPLSLYKPQVSASST